MTRQRDRWLLEAEPEHAGEEDRSELELAHTLVALHRAERAPVAVRERVDSCLQGRRPPRSGRAAWAVRLDALMAQMGGWPGAGAVAVVALLLLTWQHRQANEGRNPQSAEHGPTALAEPEATVNGVAVPGSLQWRMSGDEIGMGHCDASFLLTPSGAPNGEPLRVSWTRCDLPDELSEELRRVFSPVRGAPPLRLSARGRWARENEFEALSVRLQP
jgi:hypothetical protein